MKESISLLVIVWMRDQDFYLWPNCLSMKSSSTLRERELDSHEVKKLTLTCASHHKQKQFFEWKRPKIQKYF